MGDAAHAESLDHEIYRAPFAVGPPFETRKTPPNYRQRYFGPGKLPDQMRVWLVQKTGKTFGGVVAWGDGFMDSPDAEVLALGFNDGKAYGSVGIGRQGNFLQWGYSASPAQMTEPGRKLFLNCIHYIRKFDGKTPLIRRQRSPRTHALALAQIINRVINEDHKEFFLRTFPEELYEKYHSDPNGLTAYYQANLELVYRDKRYRVDEELKSLGFDSNRRIENLPRLVELLDDPQRTAAARSLLSRYTGRSFETSPQWRQWFEENKDRLYFTDIGGYKFRVVPEGYLATETAKK